MNGLLPKPVCQRCGGNIDLTVQRRGRKWYCHPCKQDIHREQNREYHNRRKAAAPGQPKLCTRCGNPLDGGRLYCPGCRPIVKQEQSYASHHRARKAPIKVDKYQQLLARPYCLDMDGLRRLIAAVVEQARRDVTGRYESDGKLMAPETREEAREFLTEQALDLLSIVGISVELPAEFLPRGNQ